MRPSTRPRDWTGPSSSPSATPRATGVTSWPTSPSRTRRSRRCSTTISSPIKVDREERPDVDALYMAATQLVSGHGGWPMSVFLLPDGRPFMAGTYYPPVERHGQASFTALLTAMHEAWTTRRDAVERQAERTLERPRTRSAASSTTSRPSPRPSISRPRDDGSATTWSRASTPTVASVTPRSSRVRVTWRRCWSSTTTPRATRVERTLDAMSRRGLYDHLRGGFARYSVDS